MVRMVVLSVVITLSAVLLVAFMPGGIPCALAFLFHAKSREALKRKFSAFRSRLMPAR